MCLVGSVHEKKRGPFPRLEPPRASDLLLDAALRLTAFYPAPLAALGRLFCVVLPLPVFISRDLGRHSFLDSRGRNASFGTCFVTGTVIVQVLVTVQIGRLHFDTAI